MTEIFKHCYVCKQCKPCTMFYKDKQKKDGFASLCKECSTKQALQWSAKNKEKRKQISAKYRLANIEKCKQAVIKSQNLHPETPKKWVEKNKEKTKRYKRDWAIRHPEQNKTIKSVNKANRRGASGKYSQKQINNLLISQKCKCVVCRGCIKTAFERDHIFTIALGGDNNITNIQLLCPTCNRKKGAKNTVNFMQENGYLL